MPVKKTMGKELAKLIAEFPTSSFKNGYGETFYIHSNGIMTFMSGDEVNAMVDNKHKIDGKYIELFNNHFDVWSTEEIRKLGIALQEVADKVESER